ncbi:probable ATP-dependent DNA helicase HFM1 isoform X4 [Acanthochromis polyacanthus]|uniref:probable ATP-dependent DNA helicase HFM1 isoform X4 n=1 Tax=Acanthochromis polyacanthus TaxID=80966 RepID=UPI002234700F|nr:probable ATP-dependent DNA helicase HFM1 isoform X4 [Acanthochromis polyacanthus]
MLNSNDCILSLDSLFFEKPIVHKVKPLHQEPSPWRLEAPPSLTHIPATQDMQEEAESLSTLYSFSQKPKKFRPPYKESAGLKVFPTKVNRCYSFNNDEKNIEATEGGTSSSTIRCGSLWGGEGFRDYSQGGYQSGRGGDETPQDSGRAGVHTCLSLDCTKNPPLRRSLFKIQALTSGGDSSNTDDLSGSGSNSQTTSRLQTFLSQVTMTTVPPPFQQPQATVGHAAPPFPSKPPLSPPPLGSSAASGQPPQQAPHAEMQDKGTKRAFVPPMMPQPLHIQGSSGSGVLRPVSEIPVRFRSVFNEFPFFNYVQSKALDDVLYTSKNFVACAPTGSGKTVLFELAIIRLLMETPEPWKDIKAVYMAPIKALCSQCFESWKKKFGPLGLNCKELTGDTEIDDFFEIQDSHIILTTPFCSTRKGAQQSAAVLAKDARFIMSIEHKQRLIKYANSILDTKLRDLMMLGVGYHHAGVDVSDRKLVEEAFTLGDLPVLFTTRTLAMGVNLPAHLVVIKSTMQYVSGSCEEYSEADLLQMIGRAGRPQFDSSATAVIMTKIQTRNKYMQLMNGAEIIESSLHSHLVEHLNAEIVLQTISDVNMALDWIRSTFLYIRALKNPTHYGFSPNLDRYGIEGKLQELCLKNLNSLSSIGLIDMDEDINIKPTEAGRLMARYCVAFDTMKQFSKVTGTENLSDLIELVSRSREFSDIQLRVNERRPLNTLNRDKNRVTIRFPIEGKIKTSEMKVNCLIQAQLGSISIQEFGLTQDTAKIFRNGMRISRCLSEFLTQRSKTGFSAVLSSLILAKCFRAKLWENSPYVSKQLDKIGQFLSTAMVNSGLTTFSKIEETNGRELELILNRHPPFGNQIRESVIHLPKYEVTLEQLPRYSGARAEIVVKVNLKNRAQLLSKRTARNHHYVSLIIGDSDNTVVFLQKLTDLVLLKSGSWSKKIDVAKASRGEELSVNLISSEYVGLDIQQKFTVHYSAARMFGRENPYNQTHILAGQRPQQPELKPPSTNQAAAQKENTTYAKDQDSGSKRQCNHFCKNKSLCGHDCCKVGVTVAKKRSAIQESSFSSYLQDLRIRSDTLMQTPVKRLKMKMSEEPTSVSLQEFAYKPKQMLPPVSWYGGSHYKASPRPHAATDMKDENCAELPDVICLDDLDRGDDDYVDEMHNIVGEDIQTAVSFSAHYQSSSVWMIPETRGGSQNAKQHLNQINTTSSACSQRSTTVSEEQASSYQMPAVTFDLGNEWDDWGDFDDENLVHASETSLASCVTNSRPQVQQSVEYNTAGYASPSAPMFLGRSQAKPCISTTPLRLTSTTVNSDIRTLEPSPRPNIFNEEITAKIPENPPKMPHETLVNKRLDFFSTRIPVSASSSVNRSKEEEAFLGIFDGIF